MSKPHRLRGHILTFSGNPFTDGWEDTVTVLENSAVLIADGKIAAVGPTAEQADATETRHDGHLICPGFVDAHVHYPQTAMIASWGKRLIDWLNTYTFPEEMRFGDPAYAADIAGRYLDLALAHGTTSMASYCTIHPAGVDALFEAAQARGMAVAAGKTC
ncbi:MAG: amidohydrolase family protein, partial [Pseudomonadota bacterium]